MSKYYEKQAVLSIISTFGDEDIYKAVSGLTEYNDDANKVEYGTWLDPEQWQLFEPSIIDNHFTMRKLILNVAECSNCHCNVTIDDYDNYCPRCGAKMSYSED